jgi:hypothetical protein
MSETEERFLAELEEAEMRTAGVLDGPDGTPDPRDGLIRNLRRVVKGNREKLDRIREEVRAEVRHEMKVERRTEAAWRNAGVPEAARSLFSGLDPTDQAAMQARADELRQAGISWAGQPQPPAPPPSDPNAAAVAAMQAAAAGANPPEPPFEQRMRDMHANPKRYTDEQRDRAVQDYNRAVTAAARQGGAGARG